MNKGHGLPEGEEILDFLLARRGADVLDVNGVCRHDVCCVCDVLKLICDFVLFCVEDQLK
jgi:hypothetical protein